MGDLSPHFNSSEFRCRCGCGYGTNDGDVDPALIDRLEKMRTHFGGQPVTINSGCRCSKHNKAVGGASSSQHLLGTAADHTVKGVSLNDLANYWRDTYPNCCGVGQYSSFVHYDVRRNKARW